MNKDRIEELKRLIKQALSRGELSPQIAQWRKELKELEQEKESNE